MRLSSLSVFLYFLLFNSAFAQLKNGPMLAHLDMREATVWIQAKAPSLVRVHYYESNGDAPRYTSASVATEANAGHSAVITLDKVEPGKRYEYQIELNGERIGTPARFQTPENYHERTPPPNFRFAVGGAHYVLDEPFEPPYQTLGGGYDIFSTIATQEPDFMIWLGNTAHLRPSDWRSRSGFLKRFSRARSVPQLRPLLQSIPHYATWSDADFGAPNGGEMSSTRQIAEDSFHAFWPRPIKVASLQGVATQFRYADVDFFLLDVRSYRKDTPNSTTRAQILGSKQIEWLRHALIQSDATFKIIAAGSPILNPAKSRGNLSFAEREHTDFLQMLRDERISGLFFLSGGKAYGELTRLVHANSYNLHDLTVGPLTAQPQNNTDELNFFRAPGTSTFERHFAIIECSGIDEARTLNLQVFSMDGRELWSRRISVGDLQHMR